MLRGPDWWGGCDVNPSVRWQRAARCRGLDRRRRRRRGRRWQRGIGFFLGKSRCVGSPSPTRGGGNWAGPLIRWAENALCLSLSGPWFSGRWFVGIYCPDVHFQAHDVCSVIRPGLMIFLSLTALTFSILATNGLLSSQWCSQDNQAQSVQTWQDSINLTSDASRGVRGVWFLDQILVAVISDIWTLIWSIKYKLITKLTAQIETNLQDESIKPN